MKPLVFPKPLPQEYKDIFVTQYPIIVRQVDTYTDEQLKYGTPSCGNKNFDKTFLNAPVELRVTISHMVGQYNNRIDIGFKSEADLPKIYAACVQYLSFTEHIIQTNINIYDLPFKELHDLAVFATAIYEILPATAVIPDPAANVFNTFVIPAKLTPKKKENFNFNEPLKDNDDLKHYRALFNRGSSNIWRR